MNDHANLTEDHMKDVMGKFTRNLTMLNYVVGHMTAQEFLTMDSTALNDIQKLLLCASDHQRFQEYFPHDCIANYEQKYGHPLGQHDHNQRPHGVESQKYYIECQLHLAIDHCRDILKGQHAQTFYRNTPYHEFPNNVVAMINFIDTIIRPTTTAFWNAHLEPLYCTLIQSLKQPN